MTEPREAPLPGPVKGLSAVSLCNDFASEMVYPVLPAFVTTTLGGSALSLGALDGAADLTAALVKWGSGRLADRPKWTKPLILAGYGVAVLVRPLISVAGAAWQVIGFRVVDRVGKGLRSPPRDALIAELTPAPLRGRAFGFNRAADHLGAVLGSLTAWALLAHQADLRSIIGWSAVPGVIALMVLLIALRGVGRGVRGATPAAHLTREEAKGKAYWGPIVALVLLTVARLPETLLLLRLQDLGVAVALVPLLWAGLHVIRSAASYPGGWLSDRLGARLGVTLGSLLFAGVAAGLSLVHGASAAAIVFLSYGLVAGLFEPAERVAVARLAPARTGRGFGNYQGLSGVAALPAGLLFGWIYADRGGHIALLASAALTLLALGPWLLAYRAGSSAA